MDDYMLVVRGETARRRASGEPTPQQTQAIEWGDAALERLTASHRPLVEMWAKKYARAPAGAGGTMPGRGDRELAIDRNIRQEARGEEEEKDDGEDFSLSSGPVKEFRQIGADAVRNCILRKARGEKAKNGGELSVAWAVRGAMRAHQRTLAGRTGRGRSTRDNREADRLWKLGGDVLAEPERSVFYAHHFEGMTVKETAREFGLIPNRVRYLLDKARKEIKDAAQPEILAELIGMPL